MSIQSELESGPFGHLVRIGQLVTDQWTGVIETHAQRATERARRAQQLAEAWLAVGADTASAGEPGVDESEPGDSGGALREGAERHAGGSSNGSDLFGAWHAYCTDASQRWVLLLDTLRRRGNDFAQVREQELPLVLEFEHEQIIDGRSLPRPVNYSLLRIVPPPGVRIDARRQPVMIIDPRAGHGAGIGGFKPDSQVGEAFEEGHPVYFVVFRPIPEPGQTLADIRDAEVAFLDEIARRHPESARPVVIGNCQGGWAAMLLAASAPEKTGPVVINGAPMSYWSGRVGRNPMRYNGGLLGGAVPAMLLSDLGNGVFDGALLVENFENLNPANAFWKKYYQLYANVDTEAERFLEFERWWGGFFLMNEAEIRWIVENLFIGNKLARGEARLGGEVIDLRRIRAPIIVFASHGDNITPPQQALNWIADLYRDATEIKARGQRIVYMLHESIGHLGIFVSAKVAGREHDAITDTLSAIEALPPGLYEMKLEQGAERLHVRLEPRGIDDILALDDGREDEELFAAVSRLSQLGSELYDITARPWIKAAVTPASAKALMEARPLRAQRAALSDRNPLLAPVAGLAQEARERRTPVAPDNPFLTMQTLFAEQIEQQLDFYRDARDAMFEATFHMIYGAAPMRAIGERSLLDGYKASTESLRALPDVQQALARIEEGGEAEGTVRMLELLSLARGYVRRSRLERATQLFADEQPFAAMSTDARARLIHEQSLIVQFEPEKAIASLPRLLDRPDERSKALEFVMRVAGPREAMHPAARDLYREFELILQREPAPTH